MGIIEERRETKRTAAITRLQELVAEMEHIQVLNPGLVGIVVPAQAGREVNRTLFALSDVIGGMEQIRTLMIPNDAFNPASRYPGSQHESVPLADVLTAARRALRALGIPA